MDIAEVNRLVKQFEQAKKMMKQMPGLMGSKKVKEVDLVFLFNTESKI